MVSPYWTDVTYTQTIMWEKKYFFSIAMQCSGIDKLLSTESSLMPISKKTTKTQPHPFICRLSVAAFVLERQSSGDREHVAHKAWNS